jgi:transcriptional regulator with XRE-family HTH domain
MDVCTVIKHRLEELKLDQCDLAAAVEVTESYVSQLMTRKKAPPAPDRTDIYEKIGRFLGLPEGELVRLAVLQRHEDLKRKLAGPPAPLFCEVRDLILRKCRGNTQKLVRAVFEKEPFGELERLVTRTLVEAVKKVAREELERKDWLRRVAGLSGMSYEETRVTILDFLDTDVLDVSIENCVSFLDPLIEYWDIDLATFAMMIVLDRRVSSRPVRFEYVETEADGDVHEEPGLRDFLQDASLSGNATGDEIEFLKGLKFKGRRPTPLYYYRELQNLRDPLHFIAPKDPTEAALTKQTRISVARRVPAHSKRAGSRNGRRSGEYR